MKNINTMINDARKRLARWKTIEYTNGLVEVLPVDDIRTHIHSIYCPCEPEIRQNGTMLVHSAYDAREYTEFNSGKFVSNKILTLIYYEKNND